MRCVGLVVCFLVLATLVAATPQKKSKPSAALASVQSPLRRMHLLELAQRVEHTLDLHTMSQFAISISHLVDLAGRKKLQSIANKVADAQMNGRSFEEELLSRNAQLTPETRERIRDDIKHAQPSNNVRIMTTTSDVVKFSTALKDIVAGVLVVGRDVRGVSDVESEAGLSDGMLELMNRGLHKPKTRSSSKAKAGALSGVLRPKNVGGAKKARKHSSVLRH